MCKFGNKCCWIAVGSIVGALLALGAIFIIVKLVGVKIDVKRGKNNTLSYMMSIIPQN